MILIPETLILLLTEEKEFLEKQFLRSLNVCKKKSDHSLLYSSHVLVEIFSFTPRHLKCKCNILLLYGPASET